jgi:Zn-dependent peptidase ImmA (M78 family)
MIKDRIRQARIAAGMTQDEVVEALAANGIPLTKGGLSKYERGGSIPKPSVLRALGDILGVDPSSFLEEPRIKLRWLAFRKASRMGKARQERVKAQAESELEILLTLRGSLDPGATPEDLPPRTRVRKPEEADLAADALREHWRLGDQPIESVTAAIEDGGGMVVESGGDEDLFDGLSGWANRTVPVVVVSPAVSDDRRRFNLAHELGHLFMDTGKVDKRTEEKLAHRFAAAFLVPAACARRELGAKRRRLEFRELAMLKQKYGLSMQGWILRAADLGIIDPSHVRTLFAQMSSRGWRREEPVGFAGRERPQKLRQLTVRALAEGLVTRQQAERVLPGVTCEMDEVQVAGAASARSLLRMPKGERDRLMEQAAALVAPNYQDGGSLSGLELLSEEDHLDRSVDE